MPTQETTIANMPNTVLWIIAVALIIFALSTMVIAFAVMSFLGSLLKMAEQLSGMMAETEKKLPAILESWQRRKPENKF